MQDKINDSAKSRVAFLLLLAISITAIFFWMTKGFALAVIMAAVLAAVTHSLYRRLLEQVSGRKTVAAGATVALSLLVVIIPLLLFLLILVGQAVEVSQSATEWFTQHVPQSESFQEKVQDNPNLERLLPYQDELLAKAGQQVVVKVQHAGIQETVQNDLELLEQLAELLQEYVPEARNYQWS